MLVRLIATAWWVCGLGFGVTGGEYGFGVGWRDYSDPMEKLRGRGLRFVLVEEIRRRESMSVAEMTALLADYGFEVAGRPSKVISDALRWEVARGRVKRVGRGVYVFGRVPKTTGRRIRLFYLACRSWIVAVTRGEEPPPTLETRRDRFDDRWQPPPQDPARPPWRELGWLWTV